MQAFIIDDSEFDRYLLKRQILLIDEDADVTEFTSGIEAFDYIQTESLSNSNADYLPDVMLVDICMPRMDGFEFIEKLQEVLQSIPNLSQIKFYIISSSQNRSDFDRAEEMSLVRGFIHKPPSIEDLENILIN